MLAASPHTDRPRWSGARIAVVTLVLFHGYLLGRRLLDGGLWDVETAGRWLGSAAMVSAAVWLHRRGLSWTRGRGAAAFWILVVLLHAGIGAPPITSAGAALQALPLGTFGLLALPVIGLDAVASHLHALIARPVGRAPRLATAPVVPPRWPGVRLACAFPPLHRRPPPI